jgi:hypothetical protein
MAREDWGSIRYSAGTTAKFRARLYDRHTGEPLVLDEEIVAYQQWSEHGTDAVLSIRSDEPLPGGSIVEIESTDPAVVLITIATEDVAHLRDGGYFGRIVIIGDTEILVAGRGRVEVLGSPAPIGVLS